MIQESPWILSAIVCIGLYLISLNRWVAISALVVFLVTVLAGCALAFYLIWFVWPYAWWEKIIYSAEMAFITAFFTAALVINLQSIQGKPGLFKPDGRPYSYEEKISAYGYTGMILGLAYGLIGVILLSINPWMWILAYVCFGIGAACYAAAVYQAILLGFYKEPKHVEQERSSMVGISVPSQISPAAKSVGYERLTGRPGEIWVVDTWVPVDHRMGDRACTCRMCTSARTRTGAHTNGAAHTYGDQCANRNRNPLPYKDAAALVRRGNGFPGWHSKHPVGAWHGLPGDRLRTRR